MSHRAVNTDTLNTNKPDMISNIANIYQNILDRENELVIVKLWF